MKTVKLGSKLIRVEDRDLLGSGGEADVFRVADRALKIYHAFSGPALMRKLEKVRAFPRNLPDAVLGPLEVALDELGSPIGYAMQLAESVVELVQLSRRSFREGKISAADVLEIFAELRVILGSLHKLGVVAGDLNDGNILVSFASRKIFLIDADSMQFGGFACEVGHERFLDPRLYGADLAARPMFDASTDWYAFAVLLFSSLLYVHPYGGSHPKFPTLLRRAEAKHSILRPDVKRPKASEDPASLPAALRRYFEAIFDRGARIEPPAELFAARFSLLVAAAPVLEKRSGNCRAIPIFAIAGAGRILLATVQNHKLRYLYEEDGAVRREDRSLVLDARPAPELGFAICGDTTWIGSGAQLVAVRGEQIVDRKLGGAHRGAPMFDAWPASLLRLEDDALVDEDGLRLGRILEEQTWFRCGEKLGFGFWTAGRSYFYFVFTPGRVGFFDARLAPISGRIRDADAVFAEDRILFSVAGENSGRMELLDGRGALIARLEGTHPVLAHARGKCVAGDRVFAAGDDGILMFEADRRSGLLVERTLFEDTEPFVRAGDTLLPAPNGALYAVSERGIRELVWEGKVAP